MALTMIDKQASHAEKAAWPKEIADEFASNQFSGCVGHQLLFENRRVSVEFTYTAGKTRHESYGPGQRTIHDLENIGDTELVLAMVEFLDSANAPLSVPDSVRLTLR